MRYFISLSYDGSAFCGWQSQKAGGASAEALSGAAEAVATVQESLERALGTLLRSPVSVVGAGRTDTAVNAIGYVAHFDFEGPLDSHALCYKLNAILPRQVVVHSVAPAPVSERFLDESGAPGPAHARFSASQRKYTYFLHSLKDPFVEKYSLRYPFELDIAAMNAAASLMVGTHDFSCFRKKGSDVKSPVCTVREAFWAPYSPAHVSLLGFGADSMLQVADWRRNASPTGSTLCVSEPTATCNIGPSWRYLYFRISADRFLRNMVRATVGTLLEVGRGKRSVDDFARLILPAGSSELPDGDLRSLAGESVPGHALFFCGAEYDV